MEQNVLLMTALLLTVGVGMVLSILNLLGGSLYDIREVKQEKMRLSHPYTKRYLHKPLISIIIPAYNSSLALERTLKSCMKSSYRKFEIIIVDDASTDDTTKLALGFMNAHPSRTIKLLSRRWHMGHSAAINDGFKKRAKGELLMILDAGTTIHKFALRNTVRHFAENDISLLTPNQQLVEHPSLVNLMQQFKQLVNSRPRKLNSVLNTGWDIGESGTVYRAELFKRLNGLQSSLHKPGSAFSLAVASSGGRSYYASDVLVYTEPEVAYNRLIVQRYQHKLGSWQTLRIYKNLFFGRSKNTSKLFGWFRLPMFIWRELMVLAEPLLVAYFIYVAFAFQQPVLVITGWLAVSLLLLLTAWANNQLTSGKKIKLTAYAPIMYPLVLAMTLFDLLAILASLINIKKTTPPTRRKPRAPKRHQQLVKKLARVTS